MQYLLGLTGSIGMGKSTTAAMFRDEGIPVWDADAAVHRLYSPNGAAVPLFAAQFPEVVVKGAVSREALNKLISANPAVLKNIEQIVHPLVAEDRKVFAAENPDKIILFDMPLLFEIGADTWMDAVVVVSCPKDVQRDRVLARPSMTEAQFELILSKQLPDANKRMMADHVIETASLDATREAVQKLIINLREQHG